MTIATEDVAGLPDMKVSIRQVFGLDSDMEVPAYSAPDEHVPDVDPDYLFDRPTTLAILAGFARNRRRIRPSRDPRHLWLHARRQRLSRVR